MNEIIDIPRKLAAALGQEAVAITAAGSYQTPAGRSVSLGQDVALAVEGTVFHGPGRTVSRPATAAAHPQTRTWAASVSTLAAARELLAAGRNPAALNFASAKNPGGGFLGGARAQEESLCRSSSLYATLEHQPIYASERARGGGMYTSWVIYSPEVPVFRGDDGGLLDEPYRLSFLTSPAVNAGVVLEREPLAGEQIRRVMAERVAYVLDVAAHHGHDALVLGAWGCGVFQCDPALVAGLFASALAERAGWFAEVAFAVLDTRPGQPLLQPFLDRFGSR